MVSRPSYPLIALAAFALGGCLDPSTPDAAAPAGPGPEPLRSFSWRTLEPLGDWYMHLRLQVDEPAVCQATLHAEGSSDSGGEDAQVGHVGPQGTMLQWGIRGVAPSASAADTASPDLDLLDPSAYVQDIAVDLSLDRGEHLVYWAAAGVQPYAGSAVPFSASLQCDLPVEVLERATSRSPRLFRERSPDGLVVNLGLGAVSAGRLDYDAGTDSLFAFEDHGTVAGTIDLRHADGAEHWDLVGAGGLSDSRQGLDGPWSLEVNRAGGPLDPANLYTGFLTGILVAYQVVDQFPQGMPVPPTGMSYEWAAAFHSEARDNPTRLWDLEVDLAADASCTSTVDAAGVVPSDRMSVVYGRYAGHDTDMTWTSEPAAVAYASPPSEAPPEAEGRSYDKTPRSWGFDVPAGRSHFYWGASGAEDLEAGLACNAPFRILARHEAIEADFPRDAAFKGLRAGTLLTGAQAEGTYVLPASRPDTLFLFENLRTGPATLRLDHSGEPMAWDMGPSGTYTDAVEGLEGPITLTMTSTHFGAFWYGILAPLAPVDAFAGEAGTAA